MTTSLEDYIPVTFPNAINISANGEIADENVYGYQFVNLSNCPVYINGMFLDRYFSGASTTRTVIAGSNNTWTPPIIAGERDTTLYRIQFAPTFYPGTSAAQLYQQLIVMKKQYGPLPGNRNARQHDKASNSTGR